jgi:23S rRNA pseudouridine1911/1915/1917 synthase
LAADLNIIYQDNHLIAVNKRAGDLVQGDHTGDIPLPDHIKAYLKYKFNKPGNVFCGVIHRLDRPTTGVVLFARTSKGLERMNKAFKERQIKKTYWALVEGRLEGEDSLRHFLKKNSKNNKSTVFKKAEVGAKEARLSYRVIKTGDNYSLLEVELDTGRHHQIRAQFAAIGHAVKGDVKYGARRAERDKSICLHAKTLSFIHPVSGEKIEIEASSPESFKPFT